MVQKFLKNKRYTKEKYKNSLPHLFPDPKVPSYELKCLISFC